MATTWAAVTSILGAGMGAHWGVAATMPGVSPAATTAPTAAIDFFPLFLSFFIIMAFRVFLIIRLEYAIRV